MNACLFDVMCYFLNTPLNKVVCLRQLLRVSFILVSFSFLLYPWCGHRSLETVTNTCFGYVNAIDATSVVLLEDNVQQISNDQFVLSSGISSIFSKTVAKTKSL